MREERLEGLSASARAAQCLVLINLQKRLLSSIEAFHRTLRVHRRPIQRLADKPATQAAREDSSQLWLGMQARIRAAWEAFWPDYSPGGLRERITSGS